MNAWNSIHQIMVRFHVSLEIEPLFAEPDQPFDWSELTAKELSFERTSGSTPISEHFGDDSIHTIPTQIFQFNKTLPP